MPTIRKLVSGSYQIIIRRKGVERAKSFPNQELAKQWGDTIESGIDSIPYLSKQELASLNDDDVYALGGHQLFADLGIDLDIIRNQANVDKIRDMSDAETEDLTPDQIDRHGGVDLFRKLGKPVRLLLFRDLCNEYIEQWDGKDWNGQQQRVQYWMDIFGDRILTSITQRELRQACKQLQSEVRKPATAARKKTVLNALFQFAVDEEYIDENIARRVRVKAGSTPRERILTTEERGKLFHACKAATWNKLYLITLLALSSGARKSELTGLRWTDIDFNNSRAYLSNTKNGSQRYLVFPAVAITELKKHQEIGNGLVFPSPIKPDQPFEFRKHWAKALLAAGIEGLVFHSLRHSCASMLIENGLTLEEVGQILGHKSVQTTRRYSHISTGHQQKQVERVALKVGL